MYALNSEADDGNFSDSELDLFSAEGSPVVLPQSPVQRPSNSVSMRRLFNAPSSSNGYGTTVTEAAIPVQQSVFANSMSPAVVNSRSSLQSRSEPPGAVGKRAAHGHRQMDAILQELRVANSRLSDVTNRLDTVEGRLKGLEETTSLSSDASLHKKRKVPPQVRHLVRDIYKTQVEESGTFWGFNVKKRYTDSENQDVVKILVKETLSQDGSIPVIQIRDSIRRFFQSKTEDLALKAKGTYDLKVQKQRRRNRLIKKLESRKAALERTNALSPDQKISWRKLLIPSFISSEDSGQEEVDGEASPFIYVKSLPWRGSKVNKFMKQMDEKAKKKQSLRAKRQTMPRKKGIVSLRPKPIDEFGTGFWGYS